MANGIDKLKATTPSKLVQGVVNQSWKGGTEPGVTSPQQAIANKYTAPKNQVKTGK